jgi:hypothetical protein
LTKPSHIPEQVEPYDSKYLKNGNPSQCSDSHQPQSWFLTGKVVSDCIPNVSLWSHS